MAIKFADQIPQPLEDQFTKGIQERREYIRKTFAERGSLLIDSKQMKQADVVRKMNEYFAANKVMDPKDPTKLRTIGAWDVSKWLLGKNGPNYDCIVAFAAIFDIEPKDLVPGLEAEIRPDAMVNKQIELEDDKWLWEFKGVVGPETHAKLMNALATKNK